MPPSQRAAREFSGRWRGSLDQARKPLIARRDYVMGKVTYISGVRAAELCGVRIGDLHWEPGQWGRFLVSGKGARGSGPRPREACMFEEGRDLLWWWIGMSVATSPTTPGTRARRCSPPSASRLRCRR